jgi:membrane peptidoglycan carboxypeptidase
MLKVSRVITFRHHRYIKDSQRPWPVLAMVGALLFCLVIVAISTTAIIYSVGLTNNLPSIQTLPALMEPPGGILLQPTRILDRTGQNVLFSLDNPAAAAKQYLFVAPLGKPGVNQAPAYLVNATIIEYDPDFWSNPGFKLEGITEGSHPTLAQLLISSLVLEDEQPTVMRSLRERILASQLVAKFGREKVLEWYLNSAMYGETIYGADAAAWVYFGKTAVDLSLSEVAMLVAMTEKPAIDPWGGSQVLKQQQELIIQKMLVKGLVTGYEAQQALKEEIKLKPQQKAQPVAQAFTTFVLDQLSGQIPIERLFRGGFEIITTLDYNLQSQASCAAQAQNAHIQGISPAALAEDGTPCEAASLLPELAGDEIQPASDLNTEIVMIDPQTSEVLAMVGGDDMPDRSNLPGYHRAETILSPFLSLTAFAQGMSPATLLWDIPPVSDSGSAFDMAANLSGAAATTYHGPVTLRQAFVNDYQGALAEVWQQLGSNSVMKTEAEFGIYPGQASGPADMGSEDFTSQQVSLIDVTQAYAVLANQGIFEGRSELRTESGLKRNVITPTSILIVRDGIGNVYLDLTKTEEIPITSPTLAYLVTNVLSHENARVESSGRAGGMEIGRPAAGKVSISHDTGETWAVGYIPQLVVGVWMGRAGEEKYELSIDESAGLWHAVISYAAQQVPALDFSMPPGIKLVQVCDPSGLLPSPLCPAITQEIFLEGNEPQRVDNHYSQHFINKETGLLATIFTPPELVEEKVFLDMPPQAKTWAKTAGLAIAPDSYDNISMLPTYIPEANINFPLMFSYIRGKVTLSGNAYGDKFSYYRIEVGEGLYPKEWVQVGEDENQSVKDASLGSWDTTGLQGLYVVKLLVVDADKRIEQALLQVTVDNTSPSVSITSPKESDQFSLIPGKEILLNVSVSDNLDVERVEFYVDGVLVSTVNDPPYVSLWEPQVGPHTLMVKAYDMAGNQAEASQAFTVSR